MGYGDFPIPDQVIHNAIHHNGYIECFYLHPGSCESRLPIYFLRTLKTMSKYYLPFHIIPFLLFKRKKLQEKPSEELFRALKGYVNSLLFACSTIGFFSVLMCYIRRFQHKVNGEISVSLTGAICAPCLLFQSPGRRREISLFLVPKVMQILYKLANRRGMVNEIPNFTVFAFGVAMAVLCFFFLKSPEVIHPTYLGIFKKLLGDEV